MTTIVTRAGKGSPLTNTEVDTNFTNLNTAKIETLTSTDSSVTITGTGSSRNLSVPVNPDVISGPASATDNAVARFDGTTGKLVQNSVVIVTDAGDMSGVGSLALDGTAPTSPPPGVLWFDSSTDTLNFQQNAITQQIGEELFIYGKASAAITDSPLQIIKQTAPVGASGVVGFAPTTTNITDGNLIIGVATESISLNGFGRVTCFGTVHGITTNGVAFGETWADGDVIWYNPTTGNPTNVKPTAPNIKVSVGQVIHAGSGGSGSFNVEINHGSVLGGTDSNVQLNGVTNGNILTYDGTNTYWKNTDLTAGTAISVSKSSAGVLTVANTGVTSVAASTGISVSSSTGGVTITNSAPDQTVALTGGTGITTSGTYPNFTITNSAPDQTVAISAGTGISVSGTYPNFTVTNTVTGATISDDTSTNATYYPLFATATSGTASTVKVSSTKYTYNPSTGTCSATVFSASSDERLKTNWRNVPEAFIDRLASTKSGIFDRTDFGTTEIGVSAQSLQELLPEAVVSGEDGYLSVNYGGAALVAAIELAKEVKALRAEIAELKAKIGN